MSAADVGHKENLRACNLRLEEKGAALRRERASHCEPRRLGNLRFPNVHRRPGPARPSDFAKVQRTPSRIDHVSALHSPPKCSKHCDLCRR